MHVRLLFPYIEGQFCLELIALFISLHFNFPRDDINHFCTIRIVCSPFFQAFNSNIFSNVSKIKLLNLSSKRKQCAQISSPDYLFFIVTRQIFWFKSNMTVSYLSFARLGLLAGGTSYHREHRPTRERTFVKRNSDVESVYNSECGATEIQFSLVFSLANLQF